MAKASLSDVSDVSCDTHTHTYTHTHTHTHTRTHTHTHTHVLVQLGPQIASQFDIEKTPSQQAITNKVIESREAEIDNILAPSV